MRNLLLLSLCAGSALAQVDLSGFVDASLRYDADPRALAFSTDQVELDLVRQSDDGVLLRADLDFSDDGAGGWAAAVEQGYLSLGLPGSWDARLSLGRFNAPIGFESLDAPDMYQYSHSLVFDYGLPTNFTGARTDLQLRPGLDLVLILANSWDANTETDMEKTFAGRLGGQLGDFSGGFSWIADPEVTGDDGQLVLDLDARWEHGAWLLGLEVNTGSYTDAAGNDGSWTGFLLMSHWTINETLGLTLRVDQFDDADMLRLGEAFIDPVSGAISGVTRSSLTIAPTFTLGEKLGAVLEFRLDSVDQKIWLDEDGAATDSRFAIAAEMTYGF
ncbi:MAG: outer membrane beta-barrel protein [Candidatus Delongbacteria bacterium]|nr:outer membrane beta-barrel protein [Candidatus Delongbacteria bacterium]